MKTGGKPVKPAKNTSAGYPCWVIDGPGVSLALKSLLRNPGKRFSLATSDSPLHLKQEGLEMPGPQLSDEQIQRFKSQMVDSGTPVRFLYRGQCLNIVTGDLQTKGINVIYQWHYWNFTAATAREIAEALGTDVRAVLSE